MLIEVQHDDSNIQRMWDIAQGKDVNQPSAKELQDANDLVMKHGIIMKNVSHSSGHIISKIVVLLALQRRATNEQTRRNHWFRNMKQVVREVVIGCEQCIARKRPAIDERRAHTWGEMAHQRTRHARNQ